LPGAAGAKISEAPAAPSAKRVTERSNALLGVIGGYVSFKPVILVQWILAYVEAITIIYDNRVIAKSRLGLESVNGRFGSGPGAVDPNDLYVFISAWQDVQVLEQKNRAHLLS
jgi:hypothetical protein